MGKSRLRFPGYGSTIIPTRYSALSIPKPAANQLKSPLTKKATYLSATVIAAASSSGRSSRPGRSTPSLPPIRSPRFVNPVEPMPEELPSARSRQALCDFRRARRISCRGRASAHVRSSCSHRRECHRQSDDDGHTPWRCQSKRIRNRIPLRIRGPGLVRSRRRLCQRSYPEDPERALSLINKPNSVLAAISGLAPGTSYHYRLVGESHCNESNPSEVCVTNGLDEAFESLPPVSIRNFTTQFVGPERVEIKAELNPNGSATTYEFRFGSSAAYSTPP